MATGQTAPFSLVSAGRSANKTELISLENIQRFKSLAMGKVIGQAIAAAYADEQLRNDAAFMEQLTRYKSKFFAYTEALGFFRLDEQHVVQEV